MNKMVLKSIITLFLVCDLSSTVSADWWNDSCGDALNASKDLMRAKVEVFPDPNFPDEEPWI